ncbi:MAG: phosphodiester glycosidase family protein [Candidatus Falkowbacteria bacterium]
MKIYKGIILSLSLAICLLWSSYAQAATMGAKLAGKILLNVEQGGELWYVNPDNKQRYEVDKYEDLLAVAKKLAKPISEVDFQKIAQGGMPVVGDVVVAKKYAGRFVERNERGGELWFVNLADLKRYPLTDAVTALASIKKVAIGITRENLAHIHKPVFYEAVDQYSHYERQKITIRKETYTVDLVEIDLANPNLRIITDSAQTATCKTNCQAKPLWSYIKSTPKVFAAMNATYFDTSVAKKNYYFFPVYNTKAGVFINDDQLKYWTTGPIIAFDQNNKMYYFKDSREFKSVADFEKKYNTKLAAAIGNKPRIIENYMNVLIDWEVDNKQLKQHSTKNALAYKNNKIYLVEVINATVPDLGEVLQAMYFEFAINLDGGGSTAFFYNDEFLSGPGRDIPNAILFATK